MAAVLIICDDFPIRRFVRIMLEADGYGVVEAEDFERAVQLCSGTRPDVLILGPICEEQETALALQTFAALGVRDVIALQSSSEKTATSSQPANMLRRATVFSIRELVCQMRQIQGKSEGQDPLDVLEYTNVRIDFPRHLVTKNGRNVRLSPKEYDLLICLAAKYGGVLSDHEIAKIVWGEASAKSLRRLRATIAQLRKKLEDYPVFPDILMTEPGIGYRLDVGKMRGRGLPRRRPRMG